MANKTKLEEFKSLGPGRRKAKTPSELDLGTGKASSKRTQKPELNLGTGKASSKRTGPAELNLGTGKASTKSNVTKSNVTKSSVSKNTTGNKTKPKVVTPAMIKAKGFTTLRDYLNNEKGLTRKDKKPVVKTTKTSDDKKTKTFKVVQPPRRAPRGANKIVSSMKSSNTGIDGGSSEVNKVKAKKKSSFFDSIGSGIKKAVKETKRNFSGDSKKKTGRYKLINKGTSNIIGSKNFVSDKKKKKK